MRTSAKVPSSKMASSSMAKDPVILTCSLMISPTTIPIRQVRPASGMSAHDTPCQSPRTSGHSKLRSIVWCVDSLRGCISQWKWMSSRPLPPAMAKIRKTRTSVKY